MSTLAYASLTTKREKAEPGKSTTTDGPGMSTYVDAFAGLVPAEVLTLHALVITQTIIPTKDGILEKATALLKENGHLDQDLHLSSVSIQEETRMCTKTIDIPEVRKDPVTGQNIIVIVKKCVKWSGNIF